MERIDAFFAPTFADSLYTVVKDLDEVSKIGIAVPRMKYTD